MQNCLQTFRHHTENKELGGVNQGTNPGQVKQAKEKRNMPVALRKILNLLL